jgi:hypothetical protein
MKATIEFNLPEEKYDFDLAMDASKWRNLVSDMDNYLRSEWKYSDEKYTWEQLEVLQGIRQKFLELLSEEGLKLD